MFCIKCQHKQTTVINSRPSKKSAQIWRRRSCKSCGFTFTTYEGIAFDQLSIQKRNSTEPCNETVLLLDIAICFEHTPRDRAKHAKWLVNTILQRLLKAADINGTIQLDEVTRTTYDVLSRFDRIASVQYAARHADTLRSFLK